MVQTNETGAFICSGTTENGGRSYTRRWSDMSERTANRLVIIGAGALRLPLRSQAGPKRAEAPETVERYSPAVRLETSRTHAALLPRINSPTEVSA